MDRWIGEWCSYNSTSLDKILLQSFFVWTLPAAKFNFAAGSVHTKKLCSRIFSREVEFYWHKQRYRVFVPAFGGLRGNVHGSSMARWKARSRLPISANWTFFASYHGSRLRHYEPIPILVEMSLFERGGSLWTQILSRDFRPDAVATIALYSCRLVSMNISRDGSDESSWSANYFALTGKYYGHVKLSTIQLVFLIAKWTRGSTCYWCAIVQIYYFFIKYYFNFWMTIIIHYS